MIFSTVSGKKFDICRIDKEKADKLIGEVGRLSQGGVSDERDLIAVQNRFRRFEDSLPDETRLVSFLYLADAIERRRFVREENQLATLASDKMVEMAAESRPSRHAFDVLMQTHRSSLSPNCVSLRLEQIVRHAPSVLNMGYKLKGLEEIIANQFDLDGKKAKGIVADASSQILETVKIVTPQTRAYYLGVVAGQVEGPLGDKARKEASIAYAGLSDKQRASVDFNLSRNVRRHVGLNTRNPSPAPV